jgi:hypothetical protein
LDAGAKAGDCCREPWLRFDARRGRPQARDQHRATGQLYTWRRKLLRLQAGLLNASAPRFAEVETAEPPQAGGGSPATARMLPGDLIEIVLPDGIVVRVGPQMAAAALRCVLDVRR